MVRRGMTRRLIAYFIFFLLILFIPTHPDERSISPVSNHPPIADAGGPYFSTEGLMIILDGSGSYDPDGDPILFRWDFEGDGTWNTGWNQSSNATVKYGDDFEGEVNLQVIEYFANQTDIVQTEAADYAAVVNENHVIGQSFVPKSTELTKIAVDIAVNWGDPEYDIVINVSESLNGPNLTWASLAAENIPRGHDIPPDDWPIFDFPDIKVAVNQTYYFTLTSGISRHGSYGVRYCEDVYSEGTSFEKLPGQDWHSISRDLRFQTFTGSYGLSSSAVIRIVVDNLEPSVSIHDVGKTQNSPRTQGFWKHQCNIENLSSPDHVGIGVEYVVSIRENSSSFDWLETKEDVCGILLMDSGSEMRLKAQKQLLATWLNLVSGKISRDAPVSVVKHSIEGRFINTLLLMDSMLANENSTSGLEIVKDVADSINRGEGVPLASVYVSATAEDLGSDDLIFEWNWGDGSIDKAIFFNNGTSPDPYPSTELNPISATYAKTHCYFTKGTFPVNLVVQDDDGGEIQVLVTAVTIAG